MPGGKARSMSPRSHAADDKQWPHATVEDPAARVVQHIAASLAVAVEREGLSIRQIASATGVNRQTIAEVLAGASWPDVQTVVRLEDGLGTALWPGAKSPGSSRC